MVQMTVQLNGIIVAGPSSAPLSRITNISISGVTASSNLGAGIYIIRSKTLLVDGNTTDGNGDATDESEDYGIAINCTDDATITGNIITNTVNNEAVQIYSDTTDGTGNNLIFTGNYISGTTGTASDCFTLTPLNNNSATNALIAYNVLVGCNRHGITLYHEGGGTPSAPLIYNNTIANNVGSAILNSGGVFAVTLKNNIFSSNAAPDLDFTDATTGLTHSNNLLYRSSGNVLSYNGSTYTTATIATFEATAVSSDPLLTSNYRINGNSPAINAGVDVGITTDFAGNPIVGLPDIGAFEAQYSVVGGGITIRGAVIR